MSSCIEHGRTKSLSPEGYWLVGRPEYYKRGCKTSSITKHRLILLDKLGLNWWDEEANGVVARHTCDNPKCINPDHLIAGTKADNNKDRAARGRSAKSVPSKWRLTLEDCKYIQDHYVRYNKEFGMHALARKFAVDSAVINKVLKGEYCVLKHNTY